MHLLEVLSSYPYNRVGTSLKPLKTLKTELEMIDTIENKESGLSVRTKLNEVITNQNAAGPSKWETTTVSGTEGVKPYTANWVMGGISGYLPQVHATGSIGTASFQFASIHSQRYHAYTEPTDDTHLTTKSYVDKHLPYYKSASASAVDCPEVYTTLIDLITDPLEQGLYEFGFSLSYSLNTATKSAYLRFSTDGGTVWHEFIQEPKDNTDITPVMYGYPAQWSGIKNILIEARSEATGDLVHVSFVDAWIKLVSLSTEGRE